MTTCLAGYPNASRYASRYASRNASRMGFLDLAGARLFEPDEPNTVVGYAWCL